MPIRPLRLGQWLVDAGRLEKRHLSAALDEQKGSGRRLGDILVRRGYVDDKAVARSLAAQLRLPYAEGPLICEPEAQGLVDATLARARAILPLSATDRTLRLAVSDPLDQETLQEVRFSTRRHVEPVVAAPSTIAEGIRTAYEGELAELVDNLPACDAESEDDRTLRAAAAAAPVVRLVDHILQQAAALGASDIHLEPFAGRVRIRYRIDGVLRRSLTLPGSGLASITSRIKVMAGMDISVKRRPQDGGLSVDHAGGALRIRASALPVAGGEKIVLRLLDPLQVPRNLDALGLSERDASLLRRLGQAGQGVILAAGPTGSGKSSSLFAALAELNQEGLNVVTLEDPMEYQIPGINQVQVTPLTGLTFPVGLRAILRQDPDVVMVGEIRDRETAEIAMGAAVTGPRAVHDSCERRPGGHHQASPHGGAAPSGGRWSEWRCGSAARADLLSALPRQGPRSLYPVLRWVLGPDRSLPTAGDERRDSRPDHAWRLDVRSGAARFRERYGVPHGRRGPEGGRRPHFTARGSSGHTERRGIRRTVPGLCRGGAVGCPRLSTLWARDAAPLYLWRRREKEVEILLRLPAARSRLVSWVEFRTQPSSTGIFL